MAFHYNAKIAFMVFKTDNAGLMCTIFNFTIKICRQKKHFLV